MNPYDRLYLSEIPTQAQVDDGTQEELEFSYDGYQVVLMKRLLMSVPYS